MPALRHSALAEKLLAQYAVSTGGPYNIHIREQECPGAFGAVRASPGFVTYVALKARVPASFRERKEPPTIIEGEKRRRNGVARCGNAPQPTASAKHQLPQPPSPQPRSSRRGLRLQMCRGLQMRQPARVKRGRTKQTNCGRGSRGENKNKKKNRKAKVTRGRQRGGSTASTWRVVQEETSPLPGPMK